jgi:hypothetical protein
MRTLPCTTGAAISLQRSWRLVAVQKLAGDIGGVGFSARGIELHPPGSAPPRKFIRAKVDAQHPLPLVFQRLLAAFGCIEPGFVAAISRNAAVIAQGDEPGVIRGLKPDQGRCLGVKCHRITSAVEAHQFNSSAAIGVRKRSITEASADVPQQWCDKVIVCGRLRTCTSDCGASHFQITDPTISVAATGSTSACHAKHPHAVSALTLSGRSPTQLTAGRV